MTQDTVEQADTRRGKPCWYLASDLVSNAGVALNDASFVETGIYQLLKIHFKDKPYYVDVLELFHDVSNVCLTTLNVYSTHYDHHNTKYFFLWRCGPTWAMASTFLRFLDHTQRRITVGRTPLEE